MCHEELDDRLAYLWVWFLELHNRRPNYGYGHNPLTFIEIEAWKSATNRKVDGWELRALLEIDDAYIASQVKPKEET